MEGILKIKGLPSKVSIHIEVSDRITNRLSKMRIIYTKYMSMVLGRSRSYTYERDKITKYQVSTKISRP